jgi:hypothetical protein
MVPRRLRILVVLMLAGCAAHRQVETNVMYMPPVCNIPTPVLTTPLAREPDSVAVDPNDGTLAGYVADRAGRALPGAQVLLDGTTDLAPAGRAAFAVADSAGAFTLFHVPPGRHRLLVRSLTYVAERKTITVREGRLLKLRFRLRFYNCTGY